MIIKFDHITFIADRKEEDKILNNLGSPDFCEKKLKNLEVKKSLMHAPSNNHDLFFFSKDYPTEYIFYDTVNTQSRIKLVDGIVYGLYSDETAATEFLQGIFGKAKVFVNDEKIACNMKGVLDKKDYMLILEKSDGAADAFLDDSGYGVITLITGNKFTKVPAKGVCTESEVLTVNGKNLEICFTKSPSTNIIFEMVEVKNEHL